MIRSIIILSLASTLAAACSPTSPPPQATPAAAQPVAAQTPTAAPVPTPEQALVPAAPPAPKFREVTIPEGTSLSVTLATPVASDTSKVEDPVRGTLTKSIVVSGTTVVPAGAEILGSVIEATPSARVKGRASIAVRFDRLSVREESHQIQTAGIRREAAATKGEDAKKIGIGAGVGAIVGGIAGGGSGAAVGAAVGGGAGTGVVLATRGREVQLPAGTTLTTRLQNAVIVLVPID